MEKNKIIIHGTGLGLGIVKNHLRNHEEQFEIEELWDNNSERWGNKVIIGQKEYFIEKPHQINGDIVVIISSDLYYKEISIGLHGKYGISYEQMKRGGWILHSEREKLIVQYSKSSNPRMRECIRFMEENPDRTVVFNQYNLDIYNKHYDLIKADIGYDNDTGLFWADWHGKRLYMKRSINTEDQVKRYVTGLYKEQNPDSPHSYHKEGYGVKNGDVILDGGTAEGFWALENIEKAKHAYLVETDKGWVEALNYTFKDYQEKVNIIVKELGSRSARDNVTIDELNQEMKINYIKLDIEGAEIEALQGARETLSQDNTALVVCTYHNEGDLKKCDDILNKYGFETCRNNGVMWFIHDFTNLVSLRNGVLFARKERNPKIYMWGAGKYSKYVYDAIKKNNCRFMGIIDSDIQKQYGIYEKMLVYPPQEFHKAADYIVISPYDESVIHSIKSQCRKLGYRDEQLVSFWKDNTAAMDYIDLAMRNILLQAILH